MADIFISYASEDRPRVEPIAKALEEHGWSVWWDRTIPPGKSFDEAIEEAITAAKCVVVLWSDKSKKSDWVKEEATIGKRRQILVPARIDAVEPPLGFGMIQAADLISWETERGHAGFAGFLSAVSEIVGPATHQEEKEKGAQISESHLEPQSAVQPEELVTPQPPAVQPEPAAVKPAEPQPEAAAPTETSSSAPRKKRYALKFGLVAGVVVLLIVGIWWYISEAQKEKIRIEIKSEIDRIAGQITDLEQNVAKIDKQEQLKDLYEQKDFLKKQADALSESAVEAGFGERMKQISDRLPQVQIQLANKERELIAARKGRIFVESVPGNAIVKVLNIQQIFQQGMALDPGKYHLKVSAEGYEPQDRWIVLEPREEKQVNFQLEKIIPKVAKLYVETVPEDAQVRILNIKPKFFQGMALEPGDYHVEVAAQGYESQSRWVDLVAGREEPFRFELEKTVPKVGRIFVETVPEDAQVRILNIKPKFFQGMALEPGSYHVEVSAEGYERQRRWVDLVAGREEPFRFELSKLKVAEPQGTQ